MVSDMQSIQPSPMKKISASNPRQPCRYYPEIDLVAWKDPYEIDSATNFDQGISRFFLDYILTLN